MLRWEVDEAGIWRLTQDQVPYCLAAVFPAGYLYFYGSNLFANSFTSVEKAKQAAEAYWTPARLMKLRLTGKA